MTTLLRDTPHVPPRPTVGPPVDPVAVLTVWATLVSLAAFWWGVASGVVWVAVRLTGGLLG
jgi:hypothetical protein